MNDEAKSHLKRILGAYEEKLAETERLEAAMRDAQAAFPERFASKKAQTIKPVLDELAAMVNDRGHEATVREQDESSSAVGGVKSAMITLRVVPRPFAHKSADKSNSFIEVTFSANRSERKITVSTTNTMINSGGGMGKRGEYELDALTADAVASHVLQTLHESLGGAR